MKKHKLIKKAYDTFPSGTCFSWGGCNSYSTGKFNFNDGFIVDSNDNMVFNGKTWAKVIK